MHTNQRLHYTLLACNLTILHTILCPHNTLRISHSRPGQSESSDKCPANDVYYFILWSPLRDNYELIAGPPLLSARQPSLRHVNEWSQNSTVWRCDDCVHCRSDEQDDGDDDDAEDGGTMNLVISPLKTISRLMHERESLNYEEIIVLFFYLFIYFLLLLLCWGWRQLGLLRQIIKQGI